MGSVFLLQLEIAPAAAAPCAADAESDRGNQGGARSGDQPRRRCSGADAADADQRAENMAQIIRIDRDQMAKRNGNQIEQAATSATNQSAEGFIYTSQTRQPLL